MFFIEDLEKNLIYQQTNWAEYLEVKCRLLKLLSQW